MRWFNPALDDALQKRLDELAADVKTELTSKLDDLLEPTKLHAMFEVAVCRFAKNVSDTFQQQLDTCWRDLLLHNTRTPIVFTQMYAFLQSLAPGSASDDDMVVDTDDNDNDVASGGAGLKDVWLDHLRQHVTALRESMEVDPDTMAEQTSTVQERIGTAISERVQSNYEFSRAAELFASQLPKQLRRPLLFAPRHKLASWGQRKVPITPQRETTLQTSASKVGRALQGQLGKRVFVMHKPPRTGTLLDALMAAVFGDVDQQALRDLGLYLPSLIHRRYRHDPDFKARLKAEDAQLSDDPNNLALAQVLAVHFKVNITLHWCYGAVRFVGAAQTPLSCTLLALQLRGVCAARRGC